MSSGFGTHGSVGRCYYFWRNYSDCITKCEDPSECKNLHEDYHECLHHTKEKLKMNAIELQRRRVFDIMKQMDKAKKAQEKKAIHDQVEQNWRERQHRQKKEN